MRATLLFLPLALVSFASAQEPSDANELTVWNAYQSLRRSPSISIGMSGTQTIGGRALPLSATLYWELDYDSRTRRNSKARIEMDIYDARSVGTSPSYRIVGDGVSLYRYDLNRRQVSFTTYGFYGPTPPPNYIGTDVPKLLTQLRAATPGPAAYLVHLLSDLNPSGDAYVSRYTSWDPGMTAYSFDQIWNATPDSAIVAGGTKKKQPNVPEIVADDELIDPLTLRPYVRGSDVQWLFYRVDQGSPTQTMAVQIRDTTTNPTFASWYFTKRAVDQTLDLAFTPTAGTAPAWAFQPYTGAVAASFTPVNSGGH